MPVKSNMNSVRYFGVIEDTVRIILSVAVCVGVMYLCLHHISGDKAVYSYTYLSISILRYGQHQLLPIG